MNQFTVGYPEISEKDKIFFLLISYPLKKEEFGPKDELIFKNKNCKSIFADKHKNDFLCNINVIQCNSMTSKKTINIEFTIENSKKEKEEYKITFDTNIN